MQEKPNTKSSTEQVTILGARIDNISWEQTLEKISGLVEQKTPSYVVTPNVDHLIRFQNDADFVRIYQNAALVLADGMPLLWASKFLGTPIKEKISGSDLAPKIAELAASKGYSLFLLGGREGAAEQAAQVLISRYPGLIVAGHYCPPMGFEHDAAENEKITRLIKQASPDILFVGLGSPKQERWISRYHNEIGVPVSIGIGVTFEFIAGIVKRAPAWMQHAGLEWFWRLLMEPARLWRRYLVDDMKYFILIFKEKVALRKKGPPPA